MRNATAESTPPDMAIVTWSHFHTTESFMLGRRALTSAGVILDAWRRCVDLAKPCTGHRTRLRHDDIGGLGMIGWWMSDVDAGPKSHGRVEVRGRRRSPRVCL